MPSRIASDPQALGYLPVSDAQGLKVVARVKNGVGIRGHSVPEPEGDEGMEGLKQETVAPRLGWRIPIALKLLFLAGVPVIGALLLALLLARQAQERARSAEALGLVEDLAILFWPVCRRHAWSSKTSDGNAPHDARHTGRRYRNLRQSRLDTDASTHRAPGIPRAARPPALCHRDWRAICLALATPNCEDYRNSESASTTALRIYSRHSPIYTEAAAALINATAALTQLSNEGDLLRTITMLVNTLQVSERASREQGLLQDMYLPWDCFRPERTRKSLYLVSEDQLYSVVLSAHATDEQQKQFTVPTSSPVSRRRPR
ncbi:MAG: nitrate- and nitrite sensing domain-containing protein [Polyangiaceae bacterium]